MGETVLISPIFLKIASIAPCRNLKRFPLLLPRAIYVHDFPKSQEITTDELIYMFRKQQAKINGILGFNGLVKYNPYFFIFLMFAPQNFIHI